MTYFDPEAGWEPPFWRAFLGWLGMLAVFVLIGVGICSQAHAIEPPCDDAVPRQFVFDYLGKKYQEQPVQFGVTTNGLLLEVFAKEDGNTWTLVATTPDGKSCVVASGNDWTAAPPQPLGEPT